jgi:NADH-quinone oxidoreductase subunit G
MQKGKPVTLPAAIDAARRLLASAKHPVALVSSWGSNEEIAAFASALGGHVRAFVKADCVPAPDERLDDGLLIRADKNPNTAGACARFAAMPDPATAAFPPGTDLVLVWGEGFDFARLPAGVPIIFLNAWLQPENGHADVFFPITVQTERNGHYTNFEGVVSGFEQCFPKLPGAADAESLFAALGSGGGQKP